MAARVLSFDEFVDRYGPEWDGRLDGASTAPWTRLEWLRPLYRSFIRPGSEEIFVGSDEAVFLFLQRGELHRLGFRLRSLTAWSSTQLQRAAMLVSGPAPLAASSLVDYLTVRRREWDVVRLLGLPDDAFAAALLQAAEAAGCDAQVTRRWTHDHVPINGSWEQFLKRMNGDTRRRHIRLERRLAEQGQLVVRTESSLEDYLALERRSWKPKGGEVIADVPAVANFWRSAIEGFARRQSAEVDLLCLDGKPVCGIISIVDAGRKLTLKTSYDEAIARYSPNWILVRRVLESAFARGLADVDFCGSSQFTRWWPGETTAFLDVDIYSPALRGRIAGLARRLINRARGKDAKSIIPNASRSSDPGSGT